MDKWGMKCREGLISILENESLFLLAAFLLRGILFVDPLKWHMEALTHLYTYLLCPWGGMLIGFRLFRIRSGQTKAGMEMPILLLLFAWIVFPMMFRFGPTFNNSVTDIGYAIVFFGIYASIRERPEEVRRKLFFEMCLLFSILAMIWGGLLLYCAFTGTNFGKETGGILFGVQEGILYAGVHYNSTGMMATGCLFMSIGLSERSGHSLLRIAGILSSVPMVLVIILSQSRSCRYAMLIAFAFGAFVRVLFVPFKNRLFQKGVAVVCGAAVLIGGYLLASVITDLALMHYEKLSAEQAGTMGTIEHKDVSFVNLEAKNIGSISNVKIEEFERLSTTFTEILENKSTEETIQLCGERNVPKRNLHVEANKMLFVSNAKAEGKMTGQARAAVDATFSDRTNVWRNLFDLWRSDPWKMFIGRGVGNTGSLIAHDTTHEADGTAAVHNTYLQFVADFGLIGFILQIAFFIVILPSSLRGLATGIRKPTNGNLSMGMMVVAIFAIGVMESAPLGQMTPTNLMLYTALAFLIADGDL